MRNSTAQRKVYIWLIINHFYQAVSLLCRPLLLVMAPEWNETEKSKNKIPKKTVYANNNVDKKKMVRCDAMEIVANKIGIDWRISRWVQWQSCTGTLSICSSPHTTMNYPSNWVEIWLCVFVQMLNATFGTHPAATHTMIADWRQQLHR